MFIIAQEIETSIVYPYIGVWMPSSTLQVDVHYQADSLISLADDQASVKFIVSVEGCSSSGELIHTFTYTGEGSPLTEAEASLKAALEV